MTKKYYTDKTVRPWQMLVCIVVLGISSYAFYLFVSPRTEKLNSKDSTTAVSSNDSKVNGTGGEVSTRPAASMSREERLAMVRARDEELLRQIRGKQEQRNRSRRAFAQSTDPVRKWEEQVAKLRADLKAVSDHPELAKDIQRKLKSALSEKPQR